MVSLRHVAMSTCMHEYNSADGVSSRRVVMLKSQMGSGRDSTISSQRGAGCDSTKTSAMSVRSGVYGASRQIGMASWSQGSTCDKYSSTRLCVLSWWGRCGVDGVCTYRTSMV